MTIFIKEKRSEYRDTIERFMYMLSVVSNEPKKKFRLMCALETNCPVLERYLKLAYMHNLLTMEFGFIRITPKGKRLIEVWLSE